MKLIKMCECMICVSEKISDLTKLVNTLVLSMSFIKLHLSYKNVRNSYINLNINNSQHNLESALLCMNVCTHLDTLTIH